MPSNPEDYRFLVWPFVSLLLGVLGLVLLRGPLGQLVQGLAVTYTGKKIQAHTTPSQSQESRGEQPPSVAASFFDPALLSMFREEIEHEMGPPGPAREKELLDFAAAAVITALFEQAYLLIFGSQIAALQALNSAEEGFPTDVIRPWYDLGALKAPDFYETFGFEHWLGFLEVHHLVVPMPGGRVAISVRGRAFLKYLIHQGYDLAKQC